MLVSHYGQNDWKFLASHFPVSDPCPAGNPSVCMLLLLLVLAPCVCAVGLCSDFTAPGCETGRRPSCIEGFLGRVCWSWGEKLRFLPLCPVPWAQGLHMYSPHASAGVLWDSLCVRGLLSLLELFGPLEPLV